MENIYSSSVDKKFRCSDNNTNSDDSIFEQYIEDSKGDIKNSSDAEKQCRWIFDSGNKCKLQPNHDNSTSFTTKYRCENTFQYVMKMQECVQGPSTFDSAFIKKEDCDKNCKFMFDDSDSSYKMAPTNKKINWT